MREYIWLNKSRVKMIHYVKEFLCVSHRIIEVVHRINLVEIR